MVEETTKESSTTMVAKSNEEITTEATSPKSDLEKLSPRMDSIQEETTAASPEQRSAVEDQPEEEKPRDDIEEDSAAAMQTFGFGAGMRMYAKSLAEAEKAEKMAASPAKKEPETPTTHVAEEMSSTFEKKKIEVMHASTDDFSKSF